MPASYTKRDRVVCDVSHVDLPSSFGGNIKIPGVSARCTKCDHHEESYGRTDKSVRRCLVLMRENCELNEDNFYTTDASENWTHE